MYVARQIDIAKADQLAALELAGVTIYPEDRRILPGGDTGRSIIGRTDIDGNGTAGLELKFEDLLAATPASRRRRWRRVGGRSPAARW